MNDMVTGNQSNFKTVEINGVKMEVDMRHAKVVDHYKVGDKIKVLIKKYGDSYESYAGMIIGFDMFQKLPTIVVAYIENSYNDVDLKFAYINDKSTDVEIAPVIDKVIMIERGDIENKFKKKIETKENEIKDIQAKQNYFLNMFNAYFSEYKETIEID